MLNVNKKIKFVVANMHVGKFVGRCILNRAGLASWMLLAVVVSYIGPPLTSMFDCYLHDWLVG